MAINRFLQSSVQSGLPKFDSVWDGRSAVGAMEPISAITLSANQGTIEFNNIPQTYTHLQLRMSVRTNRNVNDGDYGLLRFNNISSTASYYGQHYVRGNGTSASASADGTYTAIFIERFPALNTTSSIFGAHIIDILDYTNTNKNKVIRSLGGYDANGDTNANIRLASGMLLSTPAITSIQLINGTSSSFITNSVFSLYGIK